MTRVDHFICLLKVIHWECSAWRASLPHLPLKNASPVRSGGKSPTGAWAGCTSSSSRPANEAGHCAIGVPTARPANSRSGLGQPINGTGARGRRKNGSRARPRSRYRKEGGPRPRDTGPSQRSYRSSHGALHRTARAAEAESRDGGRSRASSYQGNRRPVAGASPIANWARGHS